MQSKDADDGNSRNNRLSNLEQVLQRIDAAAEGGGRICLGEIVQEIRQRSFGLWLLLAGLISLAPLIGDIPGITTLLAVLVFLVAAQMLMRRRYIWLPDWLTHRSVDKGKIEKALASMYGPARTIDRFIRPRLTVLTHETGAQAIALACLAIAVLMPFMEVVPSVPTAPVWPSPPSAWE